MTFYITLCTVVYIWISFKLGRWLSNTNRFFLLIKEISGWNCYWWGSFLGNLCRMHIYSWFEGKLYRKLCISQLPTYPPLKNASKKILQKSNLFLVAKEGLLAFQCTCQAFQEMQFLTSDCCKERAKVLWNLLDINWKCLLKLALFCQNMSIYQRKQ